MVARAVCVSAIVMGLWSMGLCEDGNMLPPAKEVRDSRWPLLLVDAAQIARNEGVSMTVCQAARHPESPVVRLGKPGSPDAQGAPLPGYGLGDADPVARDGIAVAATWHGSASLANVKGDTIRLRVHLQGGRHRSESPRVYAIYFRPPAEIEQ